MSLNNFNPPAGSSFKKRRVARHQPTRFLAAVSSAPDK